MKMAFPNRRRQGPRIAVCLLAGFLSACSAAQAGPSPASPTSTEVLPQALQTPEAAQAAVPTDSCSSGIIPGRTSRAELVAARGEPASALSDSGVETLAYPSAIHGQYDSYLIEQDRVILIGIMLDSREISLSQLQSELGEPEKVTFSYYMMGALTYLYPRQGLAFIVLPEGDLVFYRECTPPMPLEEYLTLWGRDLPLEDPFTQ